MNIHNTPTGGALNYAVIILVLNIERRINDVLYHSKVSADHKNAVHLRQLTTDTTLFFDKTGTIVNAQRSIQNCSVQTFVILKNNT